MNTAPLTGVPRRVPVRLVTVDSGGALVEVTEHVGCESANAQVLQVSGRRQCPVGPELCAGMHTQRPSFPIRVPRRQLCDPGSLLGVPWFPPPLPRGQWDLSDPRPPLTFVAALASELPRDRAGHALGGQNVSI